MDFSYIREFLDAILMLFPPSLPWCFPIRELPFEQALLLHVWLRKPLNGSNQASQQVQPTTQLAKCSFSADSDDTLGTFSGYVFIRFWQEIR